MNVKRIVLSSVVALVVAACGTAADTSADLPLDAPNEAPTTTAAPPTTTIDLEVEETLPDDTVLIADAIADLVVRLDVPEESVDVVQSKPVTWSDGAMGCPEDGVSYTQAVVDGSEVILGANGRIYRYHAGPDGRIFLCPSDEKDGGYEFVPPPGFDE